jgi:hypothetical protein
MRRTPTTARELRDRITGWPDDVVRRAVADALGFDAALASLVARWLTDRGTPKEMWNDPPPLLAAHVAAIWRELHRRP